MKRTWYKNKHTGTIGYLSPASTSGEFAIISAGQVAAIVTEWELKEYWERLKVW